MTTFEVNFLDHVAIRVKNIEASANWYRKVFGFKRYQLSKWGDFPIFMLANKTGIALFPANADDPKMDLNSKNVKIDHFAFNVTTDNFKKAIQKFDALGINYNFQDHYYFHSIYIQDLDNHTVELTTLVVNEENFYK